MTATDAPTAPRRRLSSSLKSLLLQGGDGAAHTTAISVLDQQLATRIIELAVRTGETMLVAGAPASEVTRAIVRIAAAYGLHPLHVDVTYNSITVAGRAADGAPVTTLRVVHGAAPDHAKLQRLQALLTEISAGLALEDAEDRCREIRRTPFRYRPVVVIAAQALLAVGVAVMFGVNPLNMALAFVAAALAAFTQYLLARARVPFFFSQIAGGFVLTIVAALTPLLAGTGWDQAASIRPSVIVASGIVLMLAGLTVVGAAQDAIDGFALTALGRLLELVTQTVGVVLGILLGLELARVLGFAMAPPSQALPLGPLALQFLGAAIIAVAVAVFNGAGLRIVVISAALSFVAWAGFVAASTLGFDTAAASGAGAFLGSLLGILIAFRLHVPSVAVTIAAILPMVPGAAVFRGLLTIVESGDDPALLLGGAVTLAGAATVGVALAVGASLGLYLGQPLTATLHGVTRSRARLRR